VGNNLLDDLLGSMPIQSAGVALTKRKSLNFASGVTATDDPDNDRINVAGATSGFVHVLPGSGDLDFAGTPGFGDVDIFVQTIVHRDVGSDTPTWDFFTDGASAGWVVFFNVIGTGGIVTIRNSGDDDGFLILDTNAPAQMQAIYFDGTIWRSLAVGQGGDGASYRSTYIVTGVSTYTVDSRAVKDSVLLVDTSSVAVTINLPVHSLGRTLTIKNWKATGGAHGITCHRNGGTGKINSVPADLGLGIRDYTNLLSDGIDNWEDLTITGT
jgi:hypothetical protein